jgi:hypothetical protein
MSCNCNYDQLPLIAQCKACAPGDTTSLFNPTNQRKIWNQVRADASLYTMNIAALNCANRLKSGQPINWNQSSDKQIATIQTAFHPTRGNSTKRTLTSNVPGSQAPAGKGVDIKHNSYDRYLNRLKAGNVKTQSYTAPSPLFGNKVKAYGMVTGSVNCCPSN